MICDNTLIVKGKTNVDILLVEEAFERLNEFDTFSDWAYKLILREKFDVLKNIEFTKDVIDNAEDISQISESDFLVLFGTRWIDVIHSELNHEELTLTIDFDSHWTPPLSLPVIISKMFEVDVELQSCESSSDKAFLFKADADGEYTVEYMNYYEFRYKVHGDTESLIELFPFYVSFRDFIDGIEKENIFLSEYQTKYLEEKYNSLNYSLL